MNSYRAASRRLWRVAPKVLGAISVVGVALAMAGAQAVHGGEQGQITKHVFFESPAGASAEQAHSPWEHPHWDHPFWEHGRWE
jgi:hypothetical protein